VAPAAPVTWAPVTPGQRPGGLDPGAQRGPAGRGVRGRGQREDRLDRAGGVAGEVAVDGLGHDPALGGGRQHPGVDAAEGHPQERQPEGDQHRDDGERVRDRAPHHAAGQPRPAAVPGDRGRGAPAQPPADRQRVHPGAEHGQQRRQQGQRGHHRDQHRGHPAEAHRAQEHLREDQQPGQRDRHREPGDRDGAPGGRHRADDRLLGVQAPGQLLPEAAHQEQAVVDGQAEAENGDHVDREDGHVGDVGEAAQGGEGAEDRGHPDGEGEAGGGDAAEDHDQQDEQDRHRQGLGAGDVLADPLAVVAPDRGGAAHARLQPRRVQPVLDRREALLALLLVAAQAEHRVRGAPVLAHQLRRAGPPEGGDPLDHVGGQGGERPLHGMPVRGVVHGGGGAPVEHDHVGVVAAELRGGLLGGPVAVAGGVVETGAGQAAEHPGPPQPGEDQERHRRRDDDPPEPVGPAASASNMTPPAKLGLPS
jgi:hypothetical protein